MKKALLLILFLSIFIFGCQNINELESDKKFKKECEYRYDADEYIKKSE